MGLPWVRLDSNIGTHDKTLELLDHKDGARAFTLYVCALGWAGGHGTDGLIRKHALRALAPSLRAPEKLARLLVDVGLWDYAEGGWLIRNYLERQQSSFVTESVSAQKAAAARKANCIRWHGPDCGCWSSQNGSQVRSQVRSDVTSYERTDGLTETVTRLNRDDRHTSRARKGEIA